MAMSGGVKIVLGCAIALGLVVGGAGVLIFGGLWWGANKIKQAAQELETSQKQVDANLARANANTFAEPSDGVRDALELGATAQRGDTSVSDSKWPSPSTPPSDTVRGSFSPAARARRR